jgi:histidine transport system ATP-binding protein
MYKLTIEGLHKSYGDHQVLKGVSLKANTGDVISLIGASGSGKSTFLRCINFLEQPNDGAMSLDGQAIRMIKDRHGMHVADPDELQRIRTRLAMVFQHFNLWSHMTVLENITMAPRRVLGCSKQEAEDRATLSGQGWPGSAGGGPISGIPLRRPATAGGHCPGAGHGAGGHAVR